MKNLVLILLLSSITFITSAATNDGSGTEPSSNTDYCSFLIMAGNDGSGTKATNDGSGSNKATNDGSGSGKATNDGSGTKPDSYEHEHMIAMCNHKF